MGKKAIWISLISAVVVVGLGFGGMSYYQATHFNSHVTIDNVKVGGMTSEQALKTLEGTDSKNIVYLGQKKIYEGKDTNMGFTEQDLDRVTSLLNEQRTLFPSSKVINDELAPIQVDASHTQDVVKLLEEKLQTMNKTLIAPKDAEARLVQGKLVVTKSQNGTQYDIPSIVKAYEKKAYNREVHLKLVLKQPIKANNSVIAKEKTELGSLLQRTVTYKLQNKGYPFNGSDVIQDAAVSNNGKYQFDLDLKGIEDKLNELNQSLSTLHKDYTFQTHSGSVIKVKGQSYGWAIDVNAEAKRIENAFLKKDKTLPAYNIYGEGWNINGVGYHNPTNNGIGNTYVEVSIEDQRIWVYKDGKLAITTDVVTGTHIYNEDTPKGVWYIEYKRSPAVLSGSEVGNSNYNIKVNYWAPFTLGGAGLHDAWWRSNWSSNAYIANGSGGCVNIPPNVMKTVYGNVTQYEPVIVY